MKYKPLPPKKMTLRDMSIAARCGSLPADRRVQVKMPSVIVDALDREFPQKDRSAVLTQFAIEALLAKENLHQEWNSEAITEEEWIYMAAKNAAEPDLDLHDESEDIYTLEDGEPYDPTR